MRELENVIARACMMSEDALVDVAHLRNLRPQIDSAQGFKLMSFREAQRKHVNEVLQAVHGNKLKAAEILRISRSTLYSILSGEIAMMQAKAVLDLWRDARFHTGAKPLASATFSWNVPGLVFHIPKPREGLQKSIFTQVPDRDDSGEPRREGHKG